MNTLSTELKAVIGRRLEAAGSREVLAIASALCGDDEERIASETRPLEICHAPRFEILNADQVLDRDTGLIWSRDHLPGGSMPWKDAAKACEELELGGHADWRLPTIQELLTLVDYERHDPCIDTEVFHCKSNWYWSSTPYAPSPGDCAWVVYFNNGYANWNDRDLSGFVRAVRAGQ